MTNAARIKNIFEHYQAKGTVMIRRSKNKELQYAALGKELSIHSDIDTDTIISIIKDSRKISLRIKGDDISEIERVIDANIGFLDVVSSDSDISLPDITDSIEIDERKFYVDDIDASFLLAQWETVKNVALDDQVSVESFSYSVDEEEKEFINSAGAHKRFASTQSLYSLELYYSSDEFSDVYADYRFSDTNAKVDGSFVQKTHEYLLKKSSPTIANFSSSTCVITLENTVVASFLEILADTLSGEDLRQNTSFFSVSDIGSKILDRKFSLRSNPERENSPFNRAFDGEGVTSEPIDLIKNGVLTNVFLDNKNAKKLGLRHTGNPRPANLEVIYEADPDYLKNSKFLFTELMAFHTVDGISGKFALEGEGFEIVDGKRGKFVKNVSLSGNVRDLFSNIEAFGDDLYTDANIFTPSITFKNQAVTV